MQIRIGILSFPKAKDIGPRTSSTTVVFDQDKRIVTATACLTGFSAEYSDFDGKEFGKLVAQLQCTILENTVTVVGTYGLRDSGERYDTNYQGTLYFVVIAEEALVTN